MQIALSGEHIHAPGEIAVTLNVFIQRHKEVAVKTFRNAAIAATLRVI